MRSATRAHRLLRSIPAWGASWERRVGLSPTSALTLVAVVSLLIVVSLPGLQGFALRENESDALQTVRLLAGELAGLDGLQEAPAGSPGVSPRIEELVETRGLARALPDVEFLEGGVLLRRHGYLFRIERVESLPQGHGARREAHAAEAGRGGIVLVAWPWEFERTGSAVFVGTTAGELFLNPRGGGVWSGREGSPGPPWTRGPRAGSPWQLVR